MKVIWSCRECGHSQSKWAGSCPTCKNWNTLVEEQAVPEEKRFVSKKPEKSKAVRIKDVQATECPRIATNMGELDRLLGGGLVEGSLLLIGGEPGVGKSTLMLQIANALATQGLTVLYICGEESAEQTSLRARRLGIDHNNLYLLSETHFSAIKAQIDQVKPDVAIVDSVQIVYKSEIPSSPGSVVQVREIATEFMHLAKGHGITTFLIGHVTKSGDLAGPRVLEHLVDAVLEFEGDRQHGFRMLRAIKNRFGTTDEIALFQMKETGLMEVSNPSQAFLEERMKEIPGSAIVPGLEGARSFLLEIQALVTATAFPNPSRRSAGLDANRLGLLLAVLDKRLGYHMYNHDVFVALAGGLKIIEPAIDLGILLAVASSYTNRAIPSDCILLGEVGLGGEVRGVSRIDTRLKEAVHMGFKKCVLPKKNLKGLSRIGDKIELVGVELVDEAIKSLLC
ncbi:MAG: DNA repair protein RadA [Verrucomicrobia bacterium]|nr:DNA repair protein RadA [Verrucomicrobiota bacterium]MDE3047706.1 DNA repair protein RadA [Verrucomicrobiota bacterium]